LETVAAVDHGADARAVHGQGVEQANQGENPVHRATLSAYDREPAVLGLEPPERVDENVHTSRVDERDLGEIHNNGTGLVLENREQRLPQRGGGGEIDVPLDAEHRYVLTMLVGGLQAHRQPIGPPRGSVGLLRSWRGTSSFRRWVAEVIGCLFLNFLHWLHRLPLLG
jgi:hypothetical protein